MENKNMENDMGKYGFGADPSKFDMEKLDVKHLKPDVRTKMGRKELMDQEEEVERLYRHYSPADFSFFAKGLFIAGGSGSVLFNAVMGGYQRECFEDIGSSLEALRNGEMPECRRWWIERTKKAGKDSDLAIIILWLVGFPVKPLYLQVFLLKVYS